MKSFEKPKYSLEKLRSDSDAVILTEMSMSRPRVGPMLMQAARIPGGI